MPEFLELPQLPQCDRMPEMNVRRGGIHAKFHAQGFAARNLVREFFFTVNGDGASCEDLYLFWGGEHRFLVAVIQQISSHLKLKTENFSSIFVQQAPHFVFGIARLPRIHHHRMIVFLH